MKAFRNLQAVIAVQALEHNEVAERMAPKARVALGALAVAAMTTVFAPNPAKADEPIKATGCSLTGAAIGGLIGNAVMGGKAKVISTVLGMAAGAVAGDEFCRDKPQVNAAISPNIYGYGQSSVVMPDGSLYVYREYSGAPIPIDEERKLDMLMYAALDAKIAWKRGIYEAQRDYEHSGRLPGGHELDEEANARNAFAIARYNFAQEVIQFSATTTPDGQAYQVGRYKEVASALLSFPLERAVTYEMIASRDADLKARGHVYQHEVDARPTPYNNTNTAVIYNNGGPSFKPRS